MTIGTFREGEVLVRGQQRCEIEGKRLVLCLPMQRHVDDKVIFGRASRSGSASGVAVDSILATGDGKAAVCRFCPFCGRSLSVRITRQMERDHARAQLEGAASKTTAQDVAAQARHQGAKTIAAWDRWFVTSGLRDRLREQEGDAPQSVDEDGWHGAITCGAFPVQIEGEVDGHPFYFRARSGSRMAICSPGRNPITLGWRDNPEQPGDFYEEHDHDGMMAHVEAWAVVRDAIARWRASRGGVP